MVSQRISGILLAAILATSITLPASATLTRSEYWNAFISGTQSLIGTGVAAVGFAAIAKNPVYSSYSASDYNTMVGTIAAATAAWIVSTGLFYWKLRNDQNNLVNTKYPHGCSEKQLNEIKDASYEGIVIPLSLAFVGYMAYLINRQAVPTPAFEATATPAVAPFAELPTTPAQ